MSTTLLDALTGVAGNAATGGILGLLGTLGSGIVSIFQSKSQFAHDERMAGFELERIKTQSAAASQVSADQLKLVQEQGANASFLASQTQATPSGLGPVWAGILSMVRPVLTLGLILFALYMYPDCDPDTRRFIVDAYITAGTTAVSWWFGSRQMEKFQRAQGGNK